MELAPCPCHSETLPSNQPCVFCQLSTCESCTYYWFGVVSWVFFFFFN